MFFVFFPSLLKQGRKENKPQPAGPKEAEVLIEEEESHCDPTLVRTGR
jgi:hypothetical protein